MVVRVGVLGLGKVTQLHHLPSLAAIPGVEVAAVCDLSIELARRLADDHRLPATAATDDPASLLGRGIDAVVVANRNHAPVVREALLAGLPVFVEKPLCWGLDEATDLEKLQNDTGVPVTVGYMKRYDPGVERAVGTGLLGDTYFVRSHNFAGGRHRHERLRPVYKPGTDAAAHPLAGENAAIDASISRSRPDWSPSRHAAFRTLAELAVHDLNLLGGTIGPLTVESAAAYDTVAGTCFLAWLRHDRARCALEVVADFGSPRDWDEHVVYYGAHGSVELRFSSPFLHNVPTVLRHQGADGTDAYDRRLVVSRESPYLREMRHFVDVVRGEAAPRTPLAEAADDLRLVYALADALDGVER